MTTGQLIKAARKQAGLTQMELAEKLGIPYQSVGQWERDVRNPKYESLRRIADALNTSVSYLLGQDGARVAPNVQQVFIERLLQELSNSSTDDVEAACNAALSPGRQLTVERMKQIAGELGVTLDYLTGLTDDPETQRISLNDGDLIDAVATADDELIEAVHQICGMDKYKIAECYAAGNLMEVWNPAKIDIVREYIKDSQIVLQKMFAALVKPADANEGTK